MESKREERRELGKEGVEEDMRGTRIRMTALDESGKQEEKEDPV